MNTIAPEHLEVQLPDPITYLAQIQNAGSVFLGQNAAEPVGDYVAGPNHVLPTAGSARFFSPLGSMTSLSVPNSFSTAQKH